MFFIVKEIFQRGRYKEILKQTRYIVLGLNDGILVVLSIIFASLLTSAIDPKNVFKLALAAGLGIAASDFVGTYFAEIAEVHKKIERLEARMGVKGGYLKGSTFYNTEMADVWISVAANTLSGFGGCLLLALPVFFYPTVTGEYISIGMALLLLFVLGSYLGKLSRENFVVSGLRVIAVTFVALAINFILGSQSG